MAQELKRRALASLFGTPLGAADERKDHRTKRKPVTIDTEGSLAHGESKYVVA